MLAKTEKKKEGVKEGGKEKGKGREGKPAQLRRQPCEHRAETSKAWASLRKDNCRREILLEILRRPSCRESKICTFQASWLSKRTE